MRRVAVINVPVGIDDWKIGLLTTDDRGLYVASLDSLSRRKQLQIKGRGYRGLTRQARYVAGLHLGLVEIVSGHDILGSS